jgi:hypothetical protein
MRAMRVIAAAIVAVTIVARAEAQSQAQAGAPLTGWSASGGYESFGFRDISRNGRPPDASPVEWRGEGPSVQGRYERARERSSHIGSVTAASAGKFTYAAAGASLPASSADTASRFDVRYEYRRHLRSNRGFDGLRISAGVQAIGARLALERHVASTSNTSRMTGGGGAVVVAVNVSRWRSLHLFADWANGVVISQRRSSHSADALASVKTSGGQWLTDITAGADTPIANGVRLRFQWQRSNAGYGSSHFSFAERHQAWTIGATYAR